MLILLAGVMIIIHKKVKYVFEYFFYKDNSSSSALLLLYIAFLNKTQEDNKNEINEMFRNLNFQKKNFFFQLF
jgi:hypothetical protein